MKVLAIQLARVLLALAALYGLVLAAASLLRPLEVDAAPLDTAQAGASLFLTEPKYVFLGRSRLNSEVGKVLVLGASNAQAGFKQRELAPRLSGLEVHNLAVGGSNITQLAQIAELVREVQTPAARRHNLWIVGLWYGVFASDEARWHTPDRHAGDTDIDIERYRYGFFRRTEAGPVATLPPLYLDLGVRLIHPYLVVDATARDLTASLRDGLSGKPPRLSDAERNARVTSAEERRKYLSFWAKYMGSQPALQEAPFRRLERLVATLVADGAQVLLVDMPIPDWHRSGSALAADYRRRLDALRPSLEARGASVLSMADADAAQDFSDEVHPKPRVSPQWSERLAQTVVRLPGASNAPERTIAATTTTTPTP